MTGDSWVLDRSGEVVGGRYRLKRLCGRGGMGEVYVASDPVLCRDVAVKIIDKAEWRHEDKTVASLDHPNIAKVYDTGVHENTHFVVMQLIDGHDLSALPKQSPRRIAAIIRDAAKGVEYAHGRSVIHRDLKPENIMVDTTGHVYVMDFGLSSPRGHIDGEVVGTPEYASPHQASGGDPSVADDVYSLGATLGALLPVGGDKELVELAVRCRSGAIKTAGELVKALEMYLRRRTLRRWLLAIAASLLLAAGVGAVVTYQADERRRVQTEEAEKWALVGVKALQENKDKAAVEAFTKAIALKPAYRTYLLRSFAYWRLENYPATVADLERAIAIDPSDKQVQENLRDARARYRR